MAYTQSRRMCRVFSPLGEDALLLQRMAGHESVSGLFRYDLELLSEREDLAFSQIVGKPVAISVQLTGGGERWFHGVVARFEHGASSGRFIAYRAQVVPWLWLLTRRSACRIFQHMTVPDIAKKIFTELGFSDFKFELVGSYPEREYCVQYRETDFNFISRLFEDVGISYFFEHQEKAHTLVVFDSPGANAPCPQQASAVYESGIGSEGAPAGEVRNLCVERELRPGAYALTDYNFEQPSLSLLTGTSSGACVGSSAKLEVYDYPGDFLLPPDAEARVKRRMEAEECASVRVRGGSHCAAFTPGYRFDLKGHYRKECNAAYLLTDVTHFIHETVGDEDQGSASYDNQFAAIPHAVPHRPLRATPRPIVHGVQTATVVGAAGKEIDVDEHARVVVQFHWDREGKRNEKSSCRVRVAQNWAGKGWGLIAHPRIGQEVVIEFLEGDPDRPLVTGRVYNGEQVAPYGLPVNSTQSGIKSRSSPGGGVINFNEIRFEDKTGNEHVYIQAEKDRSTLTKHDDTQNVGNDRTRTVDHDEKVTVKNDQKVDVAMNRTRSVGQNETVSVGADEKRSVGGNRLRTVTGNELIGVLLTRTHNVGVNEMINVGGAQQVTVVGARAVSVGGAQVTTVGALHQVTVKGSETVSVSGDQGTSVKKNRSVQVTGNQSETIGDDSTHKAGKNIVIDAGDTITIKAGKASIILDKSGDITISGATIQMKGTGDIVMKAKKILQN